MRPIYKTGSGAICSGEHLTVVVTDGKKTYFRPEDLSPQARQDAASDDTAFDATVNSLYDSANSAKSSSLKQGGK
jgi:hypothetical protein